MPKHIYSNSPGHLPKSTKKEKKTDHEQYMELYRKHSASKRKSPAYGPGQRLADLAKGVRDLLGMGAAKHHLDSATKR